MNRPPDPRKVLGRGLSALLPPKTPPAGIDPSTDRPGLLQVRLDLIDPNPVQPRTAFRSDQLQELANSIRENGIIQPLIVRRKGTRFELVAGERRWRAARLAGLTEVPAVLQDIANDRLLEIALIENLQREDLNSIETAIAFDRLVREHGLSHEEIGRRTGKDRTTISNMIRLLKLPKDVQILLSEHRLSMGHARAILGLPNEELQRTVAERTASQGLSVRNVERLVQRMLEPREPDAEPEKIDPNVQAAIDEIEQLLGTRVRIVSKGQNRGRLEIEYYSQEDLDRIYSHIVRE